MVFDSSTVITPSLPTCRIASAIILPMVLLLAEMLPTWAIISPETGTENLWTSLTATSTALSMPASIAIRLAPR